MPAGKGPVHFIPQQVASREVLTACGKDVTDKMLTTRISGAVTCRDCLKKMRGA